MATVTGMTAAAMIAIRDQMVTTALINGSGHLILTTYDGTTIDAGAIASAVGAASTTASGIVELATTAETTTGTDAVRAVTPAGLMAVSTTKQPLDDDLTAIANIAPADNDFIQRKSGVWVNRTLAQVATDLVATSGMAASTTQKGLVQVATGTEVTTGTDTLKSVSPATLKTQLDLKQPLDTDLTVIAALTAAANDVLQFKAGAWANRTIAQLVTDITATATYQPIDSDLTAIGAIAPADNDIIQRKAGAWINRTVAQFIADITATNTYQPLDSDLTAIGAIAPANDDVIQRKAGAWINRTIAQLMTDLNALSQAGGTMTNTINGSLSATTVALVAALIGGDTFDRVRLYTDGLEMGDGANARDVKLARTAAAMVSLTGGDFRIGTVGKGLRVAEGSNAKMGTVTLAAGTATVSNTSVTASSRIFLTAQSNGVSGTPGALRISAKTAATSFVITSTSATDTTIVAYEIKEPA